MKLEVYKESKEETKTVYLDLITYEQLSEERGGLVGILTSPVSPGIALVARDSSGKLVSSLFGFNQNGTYTRSCNISMSLGFKLNHIRQMEGV